MIESLKDDTVFTKMGGQFKFTSLVQHRMGELLEGSRPLVERRGRSDFEIAVQEVVEGKITFTMSGEVEDADFNDPFTPAADPAPAAAAEAEPEAKAEPAAEADGEVATEVAEADETAEVAADSKDDKD